MEETMTSGWLPLIPDIISNLRAELLLSFLNLQKQVQPLKIQIIKLNLYILNIFVIDSIEVQ